MFQNIDISLVTIYLDIVLHKFFITYLILYILVYNTNKLHY